MRVLGRVRLSRLTDESTSVSRQKELIEQWSSMHEHDIVGWAIDLDVSGTVDPFEAPELGPWFREDRRDDWDLLVTWRLDRLSRRVITLNRLFGWLIEHDKVLVSISENIDLSTWVGRLVANVIGGVAEGEVAAIQERTRASRRKLLETGRWPGGQTPYGMQPVQLDTGGWKLEVCPETAAVVHRIVSEVIDGAAIEAVANRLDLDGIPSPKGGSWLPSTIWKIIQTKQLLGHATYSGDTVRDLQGLPVLNAEPLLTRERWDQLQAAILARRRPETPNRTRDTSPLLGVVMCYQCGGSMFHKIYRRDYGKRLYRYYHCRVKDHNQQIDAETVETLVEEAFMYELASVNVREKVFIQAENHQLELNEAVRAVDELTPLIGGITSDTMRKRLTDQLRALDQRITELEQLPVQESRYEYRETDETYEEAWNAADVDGKRRLLVRSGITAAVGLVGKTRQTPGALHFQLCVPDDVLHRLSD